MPPQKANLNAATEAAKLFGLIPNPDWKQVADNIPILKFADGVTKEHAAYSGEGIKQGDVNLLAYPLKEITDPAQVKRDLDYYSTRVPNEGTPAMTQAIFALLYSRIGDADKAAHFSKTHMCPILTRRSVLLQKQKAAPTLILQQAQAAFCNAL